MDRKHDEVSERYIAFFDVDGTLINVRSLISFLDFARARWLWDDQHWFRTYYAELYQLVCGKVDRIHLNAFFYTAFKSHDVDAIAGLGAEWFDVMHRTSGFYNHVMVDELRRHQARGAKIVLVTGACFPLMNPLAEYLGCDAVLCARLEAIRGLYTGELIGEPCIGEEKVVVASAFAMREGIPMSRCFAYGDDHTDAPLLQAVGSGRMIEPIQSYREEFTTRDWTLPARKAEIVQ